MKKYIAVNLFGWQAADNPFEALMGLALTYESRPNNATWGHEDAEEELCEKWDAMEKEARRECRLWVIETEEFHISQYIPYDANGNKATCLYCPDNP